MLENALLEYLKSLNKEKINLNSQYYWIANIESDGFVIKAHPVREEYQKSKKTISSVINFDIVRREISRLLKTGTLKRAEIEDQEKSRFILALLSCLPFVEVITTKQQTSLQIIEYKTNQLPEMNFNGTLKFLEEIQAGTHDPKRLPDIPEEAQRRSKSRARQGLRILGFLDDEFSIIEPQASKYELEKNKITFLQEMVLTSPYISMVYDLLQYLTSYTKKQKINYLKELGMKIVRNSKGDNLMVESVADYRTRNIISWLQDVQLIDEELNPTMTEEIRPLLQKVMDNYISAKRESTKDHKMGMLVRTELVEAFKQLEFLDNKYYEIKGSVGIGNWASVPWLAIMNKNVTNSTQKGYYIVYLFSEDMERLYLTLAQGVTESTKEEMAKINEEIRQSIQMDDDIATNNNIELGGSTLAKKYEISTAAYIKYEKQLPSEQSLRNDLRRMIDYYEQYIQMKQETTGHTEVDTTNMVEETDTLTFKEIVDHIYQYIKSKGFYYEKEEVTNLFLSLKTKPFVILSGISGTGKTKIVEWFAEAIGATNDNNQFTLIPVRPDWNDSSDLLGYIDIKGDFKEGPLTKIVRNAYNNPTRPYIVLLDEMNLARVEYYLSDLLSVMESRKRENGEIITYPLLTEEIAGENLPLPSNVYIVGTVNMDETTHPFSKKVLDRANTIEFNRVELGYLDFLQELEEMDPIKLDQKSLEANYLHLKEVYDENSDLVKQVTKELVSINQVLELIHAQVGYRVRDEICMYINYNQQGNLMEYEQALDHCLLQKILPRIAGSDSRVRDVIDQLIEFCAFEIPEDTEQPIDLTYAKYPKSTAKLVEMRARLVDGFTSFWIS